MNKAHILIIDDDPGLRKTLSDILRLKGFEIFAVANGTEGLEFLAAHPINVVLIDLGLPDMPGVEVLNRVKVEFPLTEAIILTGNATLDSAIAATNQGAFSYLLKPYDIEQLLLNINDAVKKQQDREMMTRHNAEVERANAELKALNEIASVVSQPIDMQKFFSDILEVLVNLRIFPFEVKGVVFLVKDGLLCRESFSGFTETDGEPCEFVRPGECLCGLAMETGKIIISTSSEDPRHTNRTAHVTPHGNVVIPLKEAGQVVGVLCLYTQPGGQTDYDERFLNFLSTVGNQIGMGINSVYLHEKTKSMALHDPLTGLANRRLMKIEMEKNFDLVERYGGQFAVIMLDIDHFKRYNDTYGHQQGDRLLAKLARVLLQEMRRVDNVFRYGGEEFLVLLIQTDHSMACKVAERLRKVVEATTEVTISLGVSSYDNAISDQETLIRMADEALYRAKQGGRNRVEVAIKPI